MMTAILSAPTTWFALLIIAAGFGVPWLRARNFQLFGGGWLNPFVESSFGFEALNRFVVKGIYRVAEWLSLTQTGELNWNILGIVSALLVVLIALWLGA
jgi:hypothetical protein